MNRYQPLLDCATNTRRQLLNFIALVRKEASVSFPDIPEDDPLYNILLTQVFAITANDYDDIDGIFRIENKLSATLDQISQKSVLGHDNACFIKAQLAEIVMPLHKMYDISEV